MTIQRKLLVLLILAAGIPVLTSGLLSYRTAQSALRKAVDDLHTRAALAEAEYAATYVQSLATELSGAVQYDDLSVLNPAPVQEFLTRVFLRRNQISIAALLDRKGEMHATVFVDDPEAFSRQEPQFRLHDTVSAAEAADFHRRAAALLRTAREDQAYLISEPYLSATRGTPSVIVVAPAPQHRPLSLAAELGLDELSARFSTGYSDGARAFLLDPAGQVLVHPDRAQERARASFADRLPRTFTADRPGISEYEEHGTTYLAAFSPVRELRWVAVVARPLENANAPLRALFRASLAVLAVTLVVLAVVAIFGARALSQPIGQLVAGALEFAKGNFTHRLKLTRRDELGHLARTFNHMGQSIEDANRRLVRFNEELQQQVEERTRELKQAQQQLLRSQRLAAVGDLSAGLAHEVNNPLAAIVGNTQLLLLETQDGDPGQPMLTDVLEQAIRISDIVKDLQALAEAQRGGLNPVDLHTVLQRVVATRSEELSTAGIRVSTNFLPGQAPVLGDEQALQEVFGHLFSNSRNALQARADGRITVTTSSIEGEAVVVEVSDTGHGIPREHLERIFNPFFTTKKSWSGKGLALSICHRIIENHGGKISIQSEENVGTTVTIVLPAAPPQPHLR